MATRLDLAEPIWRGDTLEFPFTLDDEGAPVSLEGATVVFTMKLDPTVDDIDADVYYAVVVPNPDVDGAAGQHLIRVERDDMANLVTATHTYQVKVIYPTVPEPTEVTYVWGEVEVQDS